MPKAVKLVSSGAEADWLRKDSPRDPLELPPNFCMGQAEGRDDVACAIQTCFSLKDSKVGFFFLKNLFYKYWCMLGKECDKPEVTWA